MKFRAILFKIDITKGCNKTIIKTEKIKNKLAIKNITAYDNSGKLFCLN